MKLSMWIIYDWLKPYEPVADIKRGKLNITMLKFYQPNTPPMEDVLFVGSSDDFFHDGNTDIVCANQQDYIHLNCTDATAVLNNILDAFAHYGQWQTTMLEMITNPKYLLSDLLDQSFELLRYPTYVLDASRMLLALTSSYPTGSVSPAWDELLQHGHTNLDGILSFSESHPEIDTSPDIYTVPKPIFGHNSYSRNLFYNNHPIGIIGMVDLNDTITKGDLDVFLLLSKFVEHWLGVHAQQNDYLVTDSMFSNILNGQTELLPSFSRRFEVLGWQKNDLKIMFKLVGTSEQYNFDEHFAQTLTLRFPSVYVQTYNLSVVMLCNLRLKPLEQLRLELTPWMKRSGYYGGASYTFIDMNWLIGQHEQAIIALENGDKEIGTIYDSRNYALHYGAQVMLHALSPDITHPALYQLRDYDIINHTDYFTTLYEYLKHERNQVATAQALNLHRSSLIYRLHKIDELLDVDLNDSMIRLHLLFSYEFLYKEASHESL